MSASLKNPPFLTPPPFSIRKCALYKWINCCFGCCYCWRYCHLLLFGCYFCYSVVIVVFLLALLLLLVLFLSLLLSSSQKWHFQDLPAFFFFSFFFFFFPDGGRFSNSAAASVIALPILIPRSSDLWLFQTAPLPLAVPAPERRKCELGFNCFGRRLFL